MKTIMGFIDPDAWERQIFGKEFSRDMLHMIGFLPENAYYYRYLTGEEFLDFFGRLSGMEREARAERIDELLLRVGLEDARQKRLLHYSKGMLQRIGLASALIHDPQILLLDEPMSGLDPIGRNMVKNIIRSLHEAGKTIFFNTHILSDVGEICTHFAILVDGEIVTDMEYASLDDPLEAYFMQMIDMKRNTEKMDTSFIPEKSWKK